MRDASEILLVLDLDETLIHATKEKLEHIDEDFIFDEYFIYKRPFLEHFLLETSKHFNLAIWSSAGHEYVAQVVNAIKPKKVEFTFVWGKSKCSLKRDPTFDNYYFEKRLDKLKKKGFHLERILIVDDTAQKTACNYGNAIYIKEYKGDSEDRDLLILLNYLMTLKDVDNVRTIEKRLWRQIDGGI
jgi:TFIIF-interacting CTD phosphatase-like protein